MKKYTDNDLIMLKNQQTATNIDGLDIIIKDSPSESRNGYLDKNELEIMMKNAKKMEIPEGIDFSKLPPEMIVTPLRSVMGFPNLDITLSEIHTKFETINVSGNNVDLWRYYKRDVENKKNRPCFIFIHGGGWVGGSVYAVENPCRLIAELSDSVVFNIDYSLAPEKKFPNGFNDCYGIVEHIYNNAEAYGIDKNKIAVGGDSAGGNLTAAVTTKLRDEGKNFVACQVLMYAAVTFFYDVEGLKWDINVYDVSDEQKEIIVPNLGMGDGAEGEGFGLIDTLYFNNPEEERKNINASPLLAKDFSNLPKTLSVTPEFDGLRIQDDFYAKKLKDAGVDVKAIRYKGTTHAFIDKLGYVPQAEDLCIEIANMIKEM